VPRISDFVLSMGHANRVARSGFVRRRVHNGGALRA